MKKRLAISCYSVAWVLAGVSLLSSCSDDDEEEETATYPVEILGVWQGVTMDVDSEVEGGLDMRPSEDDSDETDDASDVLSVDITDVRIAINPNWTVVTYEYDSNLDQWDYTDRGYWNYSDGKFYLTSSRGQVTVYTVNSLSLSTLVLSCTETETDEEGGKRTVTTTTTYRRIDETSGE